MSAFIVGGLLILLLLMFLFFKTRSASERKPGLGINPEPHGTDVNVVQVALSDDCGLSAPLSSETFVSDQVIKAESSQSGGLIGDSVVKKVLSPERRAELEQKRRELFGRRNEQIPDAQATGPERKLTDLLPNQFVIVDLETTGLSPQANEIIEIGAIKVTLGAGQHPAFQVLVKPSVKLPRKIVEITGITQAMLDADGISPAEALAQFIEFIGELPLVTYNAAFDIGFLVNTYRRHGKTLENKYDCALRRARRAIPGLPNYKLAYISTLLELPQTNQHRALADCERTVHVYLTSTLTLNQKVRWSRSAI